MAQQRSRSSANARQWVADQHVDDAAVGWGLQWPEIYEMQVRAIARAAKAVAERSGRPPRVEIVHPLVAQRPTQTALGLSRDDAEGKFLTGYIEQGVVEHNPSETLDRVGVGELIEFGVKHSRVSGVECPASASVCE